MLNNKNLIQNSFMCAKCDKHSFHTLEDIYAETESIPIASQFLCCGGGINLGLIGLRVVSRFNYQSRPMLFHPFRGWHKTNNFKFK